MLRRAIILSLIPAVALILTPVEASFAETSAGPALAQEEQVDSQSLEGPALGGQGGDPDETGEDAGPEENATGARSESGPELGGPGEEKDQEKESGPGLADDEPNSSKPAKQETGNGSSELEDVEDVHQELRELREKVEQLEKEAQAREELQMTEEEKREKEEDILEAAGREYTLMEEGLLKLGLNVSYSYYSSDIIRENYDVEYQANHNITNTLSVSTALRKNVTMSTSIPFVYKYDRMGTEREKTVTDIGDLSLGVKYQPWKATNNWPTPIFNANLSTPTGRGQYDINPEQELSTGSGLYSLSTGVSTSYPIDPVNVFGSLSYGYSFPRDDIGQNRQQGRLEKVEPGDSISTNMGFGYALSYRTSLSISYSYSYSYPTKYHWAGGSATTGRETISSSLSLSTSWRITPKRTIIIGISKGLTNDSQDFGLSLRLPLEFDLR